MPEFVVSYIQGKSSGYIQAKVKGEIIMKTKNLATLGPFIVVAAAVLWGAVGIFTKYLYSVGFTPYQASMLRCFMAAIIIVPFMFIKHRPQMKLRTWKDLLFFFISGSLGLALCYTSYFLTIQASTLSIAAVMLYSAPIMVTIMAAILFKEKVTAVKLISIILAFTGCIVMSGILGGASVKLSVFGIMIGFLSGFGYALYNIGSRLALQHYNTFAVTAYTFIFAFLGMIPFTPIGETVSMLAANPMAILAMVGMGILCTLIPYTIYVLALNYVEVSKASVIAIIEPVAATLIGAVAFGEAITANVVVAMIIIFASVLLANIKIKKKVTNQDVAIDVSIDQDNQPIAEQALSEKVAERMHRQEELESTFSK